MTDAMSPGRDALYRRVMGVISEHDATPDERDTIIQGTDMAGSWDAVPKDVQDLIVKIENTPPQVWDDPADLPHQKNL